MQRPKTPPPTDDAILAYTNVPTMLAARYVGCGTTAIKYALQQGRAPFGYAARGENVWYYNICAEALVRYKHGDQPNYGLKELLNIATNEMMLILDVKLEAAKRALDGV